MSVLRSEARPGSDEFRANRDGQPRAVDGSAGAAGPGRCAAAASAPASATCRAASCCRAIASTGCCDPGAPFLELSPLAAHGLYDDAGARGRDHHRRRPGERPRVRDRGQRRDGQGRHLLPDDGQEAPARAGDRAAEPAALHLPRRLRRRLPAPAGRGLPRPRALRADLLQPGDHVGGRDPPDRRGDGLVHGRRRLRAGDERRDGDRPRAGHDLPRRTAAGQGGDRRGGHRRGARRRRPALPALGRGRPPGAGRRARAGDRARDRGHAGPARPGRPGRSGAPSRPRVDPGRSARRRARRPAAPLRRARDHRPDRRRLALARVQGALRRRRSSAALPTSTATRSGSWPTTGSCSPRAR